MKFWVIFILPLLFARDFSKNPQKALEQMAEFQRRGKILEDDWLQIIKSKKTETYRVKVGDTLWGMSKKTLGNPRLWPKLWEVNSTLGNPHEIEVGQELKYFSEIDRAPANDIRKIKLRKNKTKFDISTEELLAATIQNRYLPAILVLGENDPILGEIQGAYSPREWLGYLDTVYAKFNQTDPIKKGQRLSVIRREGKLRSGLSSLGKVVRLIAEIEVLDVAGELSQVSVRRIYNTMQRGDEIIRLLNPVVLDEDYNPPENLEVGILDSDDKDKKFYSQGQLLLLDRGALEGVKDGQVFAVVRDEDPHTESKKGVRLASKGFVKIVYTSELASVGMILKSFTPVTKGDTLVSSKKIIENPPLKPQKNKPITLEES